jgi:hypothetical protein
MALVAIMEPATENLSSRSPKLPLKSHPSNKIRVLLDSVTMETFDSMRKGNSSLSLHDSAGANVWAPSKHMEGANSEASSLIILQAVSTWYNPTFIESARV